MHILLVEDNKEICINLASLFRDLPYEFHYVEGVEKAVEYIYEHNVDLLLLDVSLRDGNGFDFYKNEAVTQKIKTIFLTARSFEDDIVYGLELGADDYITKPFSNKELVARINKVMNFHKTVIIDDITYDIKTSTLYKQGERIELTALESRILSLLFCNLNQIITRDFLIEKIWMWTGNDVSDNTITVYIKRLREKVGEDVIRTIRGMGYQINEK